MKNPIKAWIIKIVLEIVKDLRVDPKTKAVVLKKGVKF